MENVKLSAYGIISKNSIDFVKQLFHLYTQQKTAVLLRDRNDQERQNGFAIQEIIDPEYSTGWAQLHFEPRRTQEIAQISFTSGTEGKPKGILISHANLADMVDRLTHVMKMDSTIREYIGVPVYHSFGFGRCRAIATVGGHFYIPPQGFNPLEIQHMLKNGEINAISAVPSLWRALFECEDLFGTETHAVRWIEIGSQYMSAEEKLKLKRLFPKAIIVQHYGLTEASRATFLEIHNTDDAVILESVGRPYGDTEIRFTENGHIAIRGSVVAQKRLIDGKTENLTDENGWFITSDLGENKNHYVYYLGRADDIINYGGVKIVPDSIEQSLRSMLQIETGIACARIKDSLRGDGILIAVEKKTNLDLQLVKNAAESILNTMNVTAGQALNVTLIDELPVTPTGKIQRKQLSSWFESNKKNQTTPTSSSQSEDNNHESVSHRQDELIRLWQQLLQVEQVGIHESFLDLGGDSLTAISAIVKMKRLGVPNHICQGILQGKTIAQLVAEEEAEKTGASIQPQTQKPKAPLEENYRNTLNIKIVRGILVLLVIFAHWSEGFMERMPEWLHAFTPYMAPLLAFGTPGFAIMYGVTVGYSLYPLFLRTPDRILGLMKPICWLLAVGIFIMGFVSLGMKYLDGIPITETEFAVSFYNVLTFYLLATMSLYGWFIVLKKSEAPIITALLLAVLFHVLYLAYMVPLSRMPAEGFVELAKLLIAAKYSYLNMTAGVFVGLAIGIALFQKNIQFHSRPVWICTVVCLLISFVYASAAGQNALWFVWPTQMVEGWRWFFYTGSCLALLIACDRVIHHYHLMHRTGRSFLEILACVGLLAFPMFILHELVLPAKDVLVHLGLHNGISLIIALSAFGAVSIYLLKVSRRLQFQQTFDSTPNNTVPSLVKPKLP